MHNSVSKKNYNELRGLFICIIAQLCCIQFTISLFPRNEFKQWIHKTKNKQQIAAIISAKLSL